MKYIPSNIQILTSQILSFEATLAIWIPTFPLVSFLSFLLGWGHDTDDLSFLFVHGGLSSKLWTESTLILSRKWYFKGILVKYMHPKMRRILFQVPMMKGIVWSKFFLTLLKPNITIMFSAVYLPFLCHPEAWEIQGLTHHNHVS